MNEENIPFYTRDTSILIDDDSNRAYILSTHPGTVRRLRELVPMNHVTVEQESDIGFEISIPADWITIMPPEKEMVLYERH